MSKALRVKTRNIFLQFQYIVDFADNLSTADNGEKTSRSHIASALRTKES